MASIRPNLPSSPLLSPTLPLDEPSQPRPLEWADVDLHVTTGPGDASDDNALHTQRSGPFVIPVREAGTSPAEAGAADAAYQLLERIGVGGMGEVWKARQRSLGRTVALKRLRGGRESPGSMVRQFESEARLAAVLDHPNIVTIHELGRDQDERIFYTMKLSEGTAWDLALHSNRRRTKTGEIVELELRDHLEYLLEVANAVAFAHSRGVIHRDIKPANVMIGDYGEVLVLDWGLAVAREPLDLDGAETWTLATLPRSALICGTPAYMSPETANAERKLIGPATDVYLLGAVLYHVLYGRPPHQGSTVEKVIAKAKANMWEFPEELPAKLRPWHTLMRPVLLRAMASDPSLRFMNAGAFAEALRQALRNYDSAKVASQALEQLANLEIHEALPTNYQVLANLIARLEQALESWPRNLSARRGLALARLRLAEAALENGDLSLANFGLSAIERMPPPPEPEQDLLIARLTLHPPDQSLVSAPRPLDTSLAVASSRGWVSSNPSGSTAKILGSASIAGAGSGSGSKSRSAVRASPGASTIDAFDIIERRRSKRADGTSSRLAMGFVSSASISLEQLEREELIADDGEVRERTEQLRAALRERDLREQRRRNAYKGLRVLATVLALGLVLVGVTAWRALAREGRRAERERDQLSQVLLDEAAATTEARLDAVFGPAHGALIATLGWARNGSLDADEPALLNPHYMPLLESLPVVTSTLRADEAGIEYMLLHESTEQWITRETRSTGIPERCSWSATGARRNCEPLSDPYDPHTRPWYIGGMALRERSRQALLAGQDQPVHWTEPYTFFTTKEPGISISAPVEGPGGRTFVIAYDLKLTDISDFTSSLPQGVEQGQVFVLDEHDRVLGLPREVPASRRATLVLQPILEIEEAAISRRAFLEWTRRGRPTTAFRMGDDPGDRYWVGFQHVAKPDRPKLAIGVVVPESHFLPE